MNIAEIERKLASAQQDVGAFGHEYSEAALDALNGKPGAQNRVESLEAAHARAAALVKQLAAALRAAQERDAATLLANRAALRKTQLLACKSHLSTRDKAADALATTLFEAAKQWKILLEHSEKARAACPIGAQWPEGGAGAHGQLARLVTRELRLASFNAGLVDPYRSLPGSAPIDDTPNLLPLVTEMRQATACVLAAITGKPAA